MAFLKRLFGHQAPKPVVAALRGAAPEQTQAEQGAARRHMEAEVAADRARRGAANNAPAAAPSPPEAPGEEPIAGP